MKKKAFIVSIIAILMLMSAGVGAFAATKFTIKVNGKVANVDAKVIDGSTYLPLRAIGELLGAKVGYDAATRTVTVDNGQGVPPTPPAGAAKSFPVNITINSGPMTMKISKVTLDPAFKNTEYSDPTKAVVFDVTVENTSDDTIIWFPHMGQIVTNTKEQINASGDISGTFNGKVIASGKIYFEVKGSVDEITSLNYFVDRAAKEAADGGYDYFGEDLKTEIILK